MKPRILLTGKNGQVGSDLALLLPHVGEVVALDRQQLNLLKPQEIRRTIREIQPQLIVNAAAYTAVDQAESDQASARAVNALGPAVIAEEAKRIGAGLVHYSTDYVFDGSKHSPYDEKDPPHPINFYGQTKLEGERAIQGAALPYLIFRTTWVYATRGRNFLLTILRLATEREELRIVQDQAGAPTWSREIAAATTNILTQLCAHRNDLSAMSEVSGTYHMSAGGETNWWAFANAILEEALHALRATPWLASTINEKPLIVRRVIPISTQEYPTPARRPAYSILSNSLLKQTFRVQLSDWRAQLQSAFVDDRDPKVLANS
jgi:dTDP-4-dehydrorhamnose reductase